MKYTMSRRNDTITLDTATGTITGSTYQMKDVIKDNFESCRWNSAAKCWEAPNMAARIDQIRAYLTRCYNLREVVAVEQVAEAAQSVETVRPAAKATARDVVIGRINGICPRCGTYCYGDCSFAR